MKLKNLILTLVKTKANIKNKPWHLLWYIFYLIDQVLYFNKLLQKYDIKYLKLTYILQFN